MSAESTARQSGSGAAGTVHRGGTLQRGLSRRGAQRLSRACIDLFFEQVPARSGELAHPPRAAARPTIEPAQSLRVVERPGVAPAHETPSTPRVLLILMSAQDLRAAAAFAIEVAATLARMASRAGGVVVIDSDWTAPSRRRHSRSPALRRAGALGDSWLQPHAEHGDVLVFDTRLAADVAAAAAGKAPFVQLADAADGFSGSLAALRPTAVAMIATDQIGDAYLELARAELAALLDETPIVVARTDGRNEPEGGFGGPVVELAMRPRWLPGAGGKANQRTLASAQMLAKTLIDLV